MYRLYDTRNREFLPNVYKTLRSAYRQADKRDLEYGAIRFMVVPQDITISPMTLKESVD